MIFVLITMVYFPIGVPGAMKDDYDESRSDEEIERMGLTYDGSFLGSSSTTLDMSDLPDFPSDIDEAPMDVKWSWGPSYGWYLIVVAFIFAMIGLILIATARVRVPSRYLSQDQRFQAPAREPSYGYNYGPEQYPQPGPAAPLQPERQYKDQRDNYYDQTQRSDYYENQQQNYRHRDQYY